ncbi:MAG TPA: hypothetical protein VFC78_05145 [Tepidisphaeraceae bacterium]|nr:hypothetical protein [Tepidisphaeraceae bacterium]
MNTTLLLRKPGGALIVGVLALVIVPTAKATSTIFDLEDQATSTQDGLTTLSLTKNGVSLTVDRLGQSFGIKDISAQGGTSAFGARTLIPGSTGNAVRRARADRGKAVR